jgi:hypothetical protein
MPIFCLRPAKEQLNDPAWMLSRYRGSCQVAAGSAEAARQYANGAFILPVCPGGVPPGCGGLPWSQARLVVVQQLPDPPADAVVPIGMVLTLETQAAETAPQVLESAPA